MASYKLSELKNDPEIYKYHPGAKENVENLILNTEKNYKEFKEFCIDCAMLEKEPEIIIPSVPNVQSDLRIVFSFTKRVENITIIFRYVAEPTYIARLAHYKQAYIATLSSTFEYKNLLSATNFSNFSERVKNWLREE